MSTNIVDLDEIILRRYIGDMIAPEQSRAARAWLMWSQANLADRANVGLSTIRDFEKGSRKPIENNLLSIVRVFELAGVSFVDDALGNAIGISVSVKKP